MKMEILKISVTEFKVEVWVKQRIKMSFEYLQSLKRSKVDENLNSKMFMKRMRRKMMKRFKEEWEWKMVTTLSMSENKPGINLEDFQNSMIIKTHQEPTWICLNITGWRPMPKIQKR